MCWFWSVPFTVLWLKPRNTVTSVLCPRSSCVCYTLLFLGGFCAAWWVLVCAAGSLQDCCTGPCVRARLNMGLWTRD